VYICTLGKVDKAMLQCVGFGADDKIKNARIDMQFVHQSRG
jgi:hypothetical protein